MKQLERERTLMHIKIVCSTCNLDSIKVKEEAASWPRNRVPNKMNAAERMAGTAP